MINLKVLIKFIEEHNFLCGFDWILFNNKVIGILNNRSHIQIFEYDGKVEIILEGYKSEVVVYQNDYNGILLKIQQMIIHSL